MPDKPNEMAVGYAAAAERIEIEIGKPHGTCLDFGCNDGAGMACLRARWAGTQWFGVEPSQVYARQARAQGFLVAGCSGEDMPYEDAFFDFVFSRHSLEHVEDRPRAISEILRVLKPAGRLYVQAPLEGPEGSPNTLHTSPFRSLSELTGSFGVCDIPAPVARLAADCACCQPSAWKLLYCGPQPTVAELILEKR